MQLPFLGMVPDVGLKPTPGIPTRVPQLVKSPNSAVADAYRVLRTNLIFSSAPESTGRVILVTSANPAEGKTTTLANLAVALAQNGQKVLAVDPEDLQAHYNLMLAHRGAGNDAMAKTHQTLYERFKADESAQFITGPYRQLHPHDNNERQQIHEHRTVERVPAPAPRPATGYATAARHESAGASAGSGGQQ